MLFLAEKIVKSFNVSDNYNKCTFFCFYTTFFRHREVLSNITVSVYQCNILSLAFVTNN